MSRIKPSENGRKTSSSMLLGPGTRARLAEIASLSTVAKTMVGVVRGMAERYAKLLRWQKAATGRGARLLIIEMQEGEIPAHTGIKSRWEEVDFRL